MKNFSTYVIVAFVLWVIMSNKASGFVGLVVNNGWNVTGSNLFSGIFSAVTGAGSAIGQGIGSAVTSAGQTIGESIIEGGAEGAV